MSDTIRVIVLVLIACLLGCQPGLTPTQQQQVQTLVYQGRADLQKQINSNAITIQNGKDLPALHPLAAINQIALSLLPVARWITILLWIGAIGTAVAGFFVTSTYLAKFSIALAKGSVLSLAIWIAICFLNYAIWIMLGAFIIIWLIDSIKNHWDEGKTFRDMAAWVGIKLGQPPAEAIKESKVAKPPVLQNPKNS